MSSGIARYSDQATDRTTGMSRFMSQEVQTFLVTAQLLGRLWDIPIILSNVCCWP